MSLPGYVGEEGEYEETSNDGCPEGEGDWYGENKNSQFWCQYGQGSTEGKNSTWGADSYGERWPQEYIKNVPHYPSQKVNDEEFSVSNQPGQECSKEVEGYHIGYNVAYTAMNKEVGHYSPWSLQEDCWLQSKEEPEFRLYNSSYE